MKTAVQMKKAAVEAAMSLPVEIKKKFWKAMTKDGKNMGEARKIAGIDEVMVAAELVIQLHSTIHVPMNVDDIE